MQNRFFKWIFLLCLLSSSALYAKKQFVPIVIDDIVVMVSYTKTIPKPIHHTGKLKKTGQTKSYDARGNEVTDGSIKDDGYYQKGVTPNYSRANEVVTDHITGLQWQDNADAKTITEYWAGVQWQEAKDYCAALELGGYSDWRLPNRKELEGLIDYGRTHPAINPVFINIEYHYWSSTTRAGDSDFAWAVSFRYGWNSYFRKHSRDHVRCVRAGGN